MAEPTLEALRAEGAHRHDPVRFHYLEALARRLPTQPAAVQQVLARKLNQAVAEYAEQAHAGPAAVVPGAAMAPGMGAPLAQLNRELHDRAKAGQGAWLGADHGGGTDLKSVRGFGEVWAKLSAQQQVTQALGRGPENAGPLNSHKLMLRALRLMRGLSPDYLRRFLSQMDALLWLEQAHTKPALPTTKPGRRERQQKP